jgi:hypothetical protein
MKTYALYIVTSLLVFFAPVVGILIAVGVAIALDTVLGIAKAVMIKDKVTSRKLSNIVSKFVLYQSAVLLLYVIDQFLIGEFFKLWFSIPFFFTKCVALVIIFIELTSMKENFEAAFQIDVFQKIKELLRRSKELKDDIDEIKG